MIMFINCSRPTTSRNGRAFGTTDQLQIEKKFVKQKAKVTAGGVDVDQSFFDRTPRSK